MSYPKDIVEQNTYTWQKPAEEGYTYFQLNSLSGVHQDKLVEIRVRQVPVDTDNDGTIDFFRIAISARRVEEDGSTTMVGTVPAKIKERTPAVAMAEVGKNVDPPEWVSSHISTLITELIDLEITLPTFGFLPIANS